MVRGLIGGLMSGGVVVGLGLGAASLMAPLPPGANRAEAPAAQPMPEAAPQVALAPAATDLPEGSEFARTAREPSPVLPAPQGTPQAGPAAPLALAPEAENAAPPVISTDPGAPPQAAEPAPAPQAAPETPALALAEPPEAETPLPVPPPGEALAPELAAPETAPETAKPEAASPEAAHQPATDLPPVHRPAEEAAPPAEAPAAEPAEAPAPESEIVLVPDGANPERPRVFSLERAGEAAPPGTPAPSLTNAPQVRTGRLPQIGATPEAAAEAAAEAATAGATRRYARPYTPEPGKPMLSILLVDPGAAAGGLDANTLKTLDLPITIALDPQRPDARAAAEDYRAAGFEVAILAQDLPAGATPADLEVALEVWRDTIPEAMALVESATPKIQNNRPLAQQLVKALAADGLGVVTQSQGLDAEGQLAVAAGLPAAKVWRVLDGARERGAVIERTLARAAFEAQRDGRVIVMLSAWPESIAGLTTWAAGAQEVTLAPVSAQMLGE